MESAHRIVSSEAEELIVVDQNDEQTGYLSKAECHDGGGVLHRAFSVFLFDKNGRLLLQRRAESKRLWPGYWSNSCCSHPRRGESMSIATRRRLHDELNVDTELEFVYKFNYEAAFENAGSENELCHVYLGRVPADVRPNDHEIAEIRFVTARDLGEELRASPDSFTPWLQLEWQALTGKYRRLFREYGQL